MSSAQIVQYVHLLFTVLWIGGMLYMPLVLMPAMAAIDPPQRGRLMGAVAKRFSMIAWISVVVLLVTGFLKTPSSILFDSSSDYGRILLIKHIVIGLMIIVGLLITFTVAPKLIQLVPKPGEAPHPAFLRAQARVKVLSSTNLVLGLVVLFLVSMLT